MGLLQPLRQTARCRQIYSSNNVFIIDAILFKLSSLYPVETYLTMPFLSIKKFVGRVLIPYKIPIVWLGSVPTLKSIPYFFNRKISRGLPRGQP